MMIKHETIERGFCKVTLDFPGITLYFSLNKIIAFRKGMELFISKRRPVWGSTTRRHLDYINSDKSKRIPYEKFEALLKDELLF